MKSYLKIVKNVEEQPSAITNMPAASNIDVLLPKHITDSCYASITQIYRDMFELTPKSSLKASSSSQSSSSNRLSFKAVISPGRFVGGSSSTAINSGENIIQDMYQEQRKAPLSRIFSFGSIKKNNSASINNGPMYYGEYREVSPYNHQDDHISQSPSPHYYGDKDMRRSDRRFDKNYYYGNYSGAKFDKKSRMRASWHEGDTKKAVIGTKIEFVTKL